MVSWGLLRKNIISAHGLFLLISVSVVLFFVLTTPLGWGLDEQVHAPRIYQIAQGNLYPDPSPTSPNVYGGQIPNNFQDAFTEGWAQSNSVNRGMVAYARHDKALENNATQLADKPIKDKASFYDFGAAGPYTPFVYVPASLGLRIGQTINGSVGTAATLARLFQAAVYIVSGFVALYIVRRLRVRWLVFVAALLPSSLYQASVLSADAVTTGVVLVFSALMLEILISSKLLRRNQVFLLYATVSALALIKPSYALFAISVLFIPTSRFKNQKQSNIIKLSLLGIWAVALSLASLKGLMYSPAIAQYQGELASRIDMIAQFKWMILHPLSATSVLLSTVTLDALPWYQSFVGLFGYTTIPVPFIAMLYVGLLLFLTGGYAEKPKETRSAPYLLVLSLLAALSVLVILYGTFNVVGHRIIGGVQGRYFIPCAIFAVYGFMITLRLKIIASSKLMNIFIPVSMALILVYTTAMYAVSMY